MLPDFKYAEELAKRPNCPPKSARKIDKKAFRFVHEAIEDERNFLPVIILNPGRRDELREEMLCDAYALSMFVSKETAEKKFVSLRKRNKNIHKRIGSHLAVGDIVGTDGISTDANTEGHFSLYEFKDVTWEDRFAIVGDLRGIG